MPKSYVRVQYIIAIALAFLKSSKEDSAILDGDCSMKSMDETVLVAAVLAVVSVVVVVVVLVVVL